MNSFSGSGLIPNSYDGKHGTVYAGGDPGAVFPGGEPGTDDVIGTVGKTLLMNVLLGANGGPKPTGVPDGKVHFLDDKEKKILDNLIYCLLSSGLKDHFFTRFPTTGSIPLGFPGPDGEVYFLKVGAKKILNTLILDFLIDEANNGGSGEPGPIIDPYGSGEPGTIIDPYGPGEPGPIIDPYGPGEPGPIIDPYGPGEPGPIIDLYGSGEPEPIVDPYVPDGVLVDPPMVDEPGFH